MISPRKKLPCARANENSRRLAFAGVFLFFALCALLSAPAASFFRTYYVNGQYCPPGSLGEHLFSEHARLTNGADKTPELTTARGFTLTTWNTNFFYFACSNITGQSHYNSNSGGSFELFKKTALSRVVLVTANHIGGDDGQWGGYSNQWFQFVDRTNGQHWRRAVNSLGRGNATDGDYRLIVLETPLPASIEPMPVIWPTTLSNKLANRIAEPYPRANACQHSRLLSPLYGVNMGDEHSAESGDSGSPSWIVVSNRCYFVPNTYAAPGIYNAAQFLADFNAVTTNGGFTTNTYPLTIETLSQFPDL